jgi:DNA repair exonuclease SbcCD ATPase subunit
MLTVTSITLDTVTVHDKTTVALPKTGLVLLTGRNGSGKSTCIEAVAYAHWGKTIRDAHPWAEDLDGSIRVASQYGTVSVVRKSGKLSMSIQQGDTVVHKGGVEQGRVLIRHDVGLWDLWSRTHVLSSADAACFTSARDSERKHIIESLLRLTRFDDALKRAKQARDAAATDLQAHDRDTATLRIDVSTAHARVRECAESRPRELEVPPEPPDPGAEPPNSDAAELRLRQSKSVSDRLRRLGTSELQIATQAHQDALARRRGAEDVVTRMRAGACPTCGRDWEYGAVNAADSAFRDACATVIATAKAVQEQAGIREGLLAEQDQIQQVCQDEIQRAREAAQAWRTAMQVRRSWQTWTAKAQEQHDAAMARWRAQLEAAQAALRTAEDALVSHEFERPALADALAIEQHCCEVLGLKGARAIVLRRALEATTVLANTWLSQLETASGRIQIEITGARPLRDGGTADEIGIQVTGAGGGLGYAALSQGERRRVDTAILLALAEVATISSGMQPGTLWLDEVFDLLDDVGTVQACSILREVARRRCCVVISHDATVAQYLRADLHYRFDSGTLTSL